MNANLVPASHGGNIQAVAERYGVDPASLVDFSANINPLGPPPGVVAALKTIANDPQRLTGYPNPNAHPLRETIGAHLDIEPDCIAVGNGAAAVLQAAFRAIAPNRCILPVPAFSEYRHIASVLGIPVEPIPLGADFTFDLAATIDAIVPGSVLVFSNPHNPSGAMLSVAAIAQLLRACNDRRASMVIDEAFIDYVPHETCYDRALRYGCAIVVRSLTKFYAIPGLRVGYAISKMAGRIREQLPCWPVGVCETQAAMAALDAKDYERKTIAANATERNTLVSGLAAQGIRVFPASANFVLAELPLEVSKMEAFLEGLVMQRGIVVRDCRDYETLQSRALIRIAVRSAADNRRLLDALSEELA